MKRLYVLINNKLDPIYGAVQGGHAVAQYLIEHKDVEDSWKNEYLIYLKCNVKYWKWKLNLMKKDFSCFYEPDLDNKLTAIAVEDPGKMFKSLKLLRS